ncbi:DUF2256 domain-containing protein [bacterium]|nr:DUF2256 domain-containing protein [bacterium]
MRLKRYFPAKSYIACGRQFVWRCKGTGCWETINYCSDRCRRGRRTLRQSERRVL